MAPEYRESFERLQCVGGVGRSVGGGGGGEQGATAWVENIPFKLRFSSGRVHAATDEENRLLIRRP